MRLCYVEACATLKNSETRREASSMATTSETTQDDSSMRLSVTNFGPIAKADIELRPLTVFVGPSNTGKSYLASLIYALHNSFFRIFSPQNIMHPAQEMNGNSSFELTKTKQADFIEWASQTFPSDVPEENINNESNYAIPTKIQEIFDEFIKHYYSRTIKEEIERCFGVNTINDLIRYNSNKKISDVEIHSNLNEALNSPKACINIARNSLEFSTLIPANLFQISGISATFLSLFISEKNGMTFPEELATEIMLNRITSEIARSNMKQLSHPAFYLPADRTGVIHAHQVVMSSLIRGATTAGISHKLGLPILSGVLGDFLNELLTIAKAAENKDGITTVATHIEEKILDGSIFDSSIYSEKEYEDIPHSEFGYRPHGWKKSLPLMNASSMVSELVPVVLYLRHKVRPGNTLIIEEPEAHLHPSKQVELIRQLALLTKEGVRIIITTHSEWVLEAISNIVKVSGLSADQRNGLPSEKIDLKPSDLGIWLFKPKNIPKGSKIEEIKINDNSIDLPDDYYDVMLSLYNEHVEADNRISETSVS